MNYTISKTWLFVSALLSAFIINGCCGDCGSKYLGEFALSQEARDFLSFTQKDSRAFNSPGFQPFTFSYQAPITNLEELQTNCEDNGSCGSCCDNYEGEQIYIQIQFTRWYHCF